MQNNKILLGGIAGGIAFFMLGWLLYGMLVMDFMHNNGGGASNVDKMPMEMWALVLGSMALGFLFAVIFAMWAKMPSPMVALKAGAIIGALMATSRDLTSFGTTNILNLKATFVDIAVFTVMCAIGALVVAWVMGMGKKPE